MADIVTGGAGFIGSHLVDRLVETGRKVIVIDKNPKPTNISTQIDTGKVLYLHGDINVVDLDHYFKKADHVYHLAALADIVPSIQNPEQYFKTNVVGTLKVMEACRKAEVKRVVYAASGSCYGNNPVVPTPETHPCDPQYPYALTKFLGEQIVMHWSKVYAIPAVSLRLFNVYGPRSRTNGTYGAVFGVFLAQLLAGIPYTVVGDGHQQRDFTYVADAVEAFILAANSHHTEEIYNVGTGSPEEINYITKLLGGAVTHIPKRPGEPDITHADIHRIKQDLGWLPKVNIEEGINKLLQNIDYWKDAPVWTPETIAQETKEWFSRLGRPV